MDDTQDLQELKKELKSLQDNFTSLQKAVVDLSAKKVDDIQDGVVREVSSVLDLIEDKIAQYKEKSVSLMDTLNHDLKQKPFVSIAIAFGAGVLLTKLLRSGK